MGTPQKKTGKLKNNIKKKKVLVKRRHFSGGRERRREVSAVGGLVGILGRQDTWRVGEGRRKRNFLGPRQKRAKKRQKNVQSRRLAVNKQVEEVREQNRFRGVEG
jgi:hypothetical protein